MPTLKPSTGWLSIYRREVQPMCKGVALVREPRAERSAAEWRTTVADGLLSVKMRGHARFLVV